MADTYTGLIASQHRKPCFSALVHALTDPLREVQELLEQLRAAFALDDATGVQLDATGEWIGRTRWLPVPLDNVFFAWADENFGWGDAAWRGLWDATTAMRRLPDAIYRTLLRAKVAANAWDGTTPDAYRAWDTAFAGSGGIILIQDNGDMSITMGMVGLDPDKATLSLLTSGYLPLKPEGVRVAGFYLAPPRVPAFGVDVYDPVYKGVDEGHWQDSEDDGIVPLLGWGCDGLYLQGWGKGHWGMRYGGGDTAAATPDTSRWWGGRLRGDTALVREAFAWGGTASNGWAQGAWKYST